MKRRQLLLDNVERQQSSAVPGQLNTPEDLMSLQSKLQAQMNSLIFVLESYHGKNQWQNFLKGAAGTDNTGDYGYFGPSPGLGPSPLAAPNPSGVASLAGFAADMTLALTGALKYQLAINKELKSIKKDPTAVKNAIRTAYCAMVDTFCTTGGIMVQCADSDLGAQKYYKAGLNMQIATKTWDLAWCYQWCASV
jgi:hypothetical protein